MNWTSATSFSLDGVDFVLEDLGTSYDGEAYSVMKPAAFLDAYGQVLAAAPTRNVFELGIRKGGSTVLFASLFQPDRIVSIDITGPVPALEKFRGEHPDGGRVSAHYRTSQDDEARLNEILAQEFDGPLDVVLDDASHDYHLTRASFEILFPRLRPGGYYVIEDWQWAHAPGFMLWTDKPALSNLVFQLMMVCAGHPDLVARIQLYPGVAFVQKGGSAASDGRLELEKLCWMQDRTFNLL